jgi:hypothetical protein
MQIYPGVYYYDMERVERRRKESSWVALDPGVLYN